MSKISLSTAWLKDRDEDIEEFVNQARVWGFRWLELTSALSEKGLKKILKIGTARISSIHCPCSPIALAQRAAPDNPSLSSLDKEERARAVYYATSTIEFASQIGAEAVVIHCGFVDSALKGAPNCSASNLRFLKNELHRLFDQGLAKSEQYQRIKERYQEVRQAKSTNYFESAKKSLDILVNVASKYEIKLGIEIRDSFHEIPQFEEMEEILKEYSGAPIGYWHDVGHAEKTSRLGFTPHKQWLKRFKDKMIGAHIHDVVGLKDHYVPGVGEVDWHLIGQYIRDCPIKVCEVGGWNDKHKMAEVIPFLKSYC